MEKSKLMSGPILVLGLVQLIESLAVYLRGVLPGVRVEHVPGGCLYGTLS